MILCVSDRIIQYIDAILIKCRSNGSDTAPTFNQRWADASLMYLVFQGAKWLAIF